MLCCADSCILQFDNMSFEGCFIQGELRDVLETERLDLRGDGALDAYGVAG